MPTSTGDRRAKRLVKKEQAKVKAARHRRRTLRAKATGKRQTILRGRNGPN